VLSDRVGEVKNLLAVVALVVLADDSAGVIIPGENDWGDFGSLEGDDEEEVEDEIEY